VRGWGKRRVRVLAGLSLRARLVQILGPVRALRVAQAVARMGGPVLGVDWGRQRFLGRALRTLVQVRGEVLSLLIVNGTQEAATRQLLDQAVQALAARWER
jgi:hypothetical protein